MKQWPKVGSKVIFEGSSEWFFFQNILKDANDLLEIGKEYTISNVQINSSWCSISLKEFPEKKFSLSWFNYDKDLTTEEVKMSQLDAFETVKYEYVSLKELKDRKQNDNHS